ncbi:MAG: transcriptional antiterminator, Rof [Halobacteria archaeon]|nr:transcriptional antiterminator, Rof [Halobacteria archaeon]
MMTDYKPIDCGLYSEYEVAILHRNRLRLSWRDSKENIHIEVFTPNDLRTRKGEEFLVVTGQDGGQQEIRLDRILHSKPA